MMLISKLNCHSTPAKCFLLTALVLLWFPLQAHAMCRFPGYLQSTDGSVWTAQYGFRGYFKLDIFTVTHCQENNTCIEYEEKCVSKHGHKYIVKYTRKDAKVSQFLCKQYIKRSNTVIQVKYSDKSPHMSTNLCDEDKMRLDHWPLVKFNSDFSKKKITCPFSGGYNMQMYDPQHTKGYFQCDNEVIPPRIESDCEEEEGITIDFKNRDCIHKNLGMSNDIVQKFDCIAEWTTGKYKFVIIRPSSGDYKAWCLKLTRPFDNLVEGYLFMKFVCDPGDINGNITETIHYLRIHFNKLLIPSICANRLDHCDLRWCDLEYRRDCALSCGVCSGEIDVCPFKEAVYGSWIESSGSATKFVNISIYEMYMSGLGNFQCLETKGKEYENRTVLWQIFENGCFPRFRCLEMEKISSSVMQYRLGTAVDWPLSAGPRSQSAVCQGERFRYSHRFERKVNIPMKVIIQSDSSYRVNCNLHEKFGFSTSRVYISNESCNGCISYDRNQSPTRLTETIINCSSHVRHHHQIAHVCLASLEIESDIRAVVTKRQVSGRHHDEEYRCWVFIANHNTKTVYFLDASDCNVDTLGNMKTNSMQFNAKYNINENGTHKCPYDMTIPVTTTKHTSPFISIHTETEPTIDIFEPPQKGKSVDADGDSGSYVHVDVTMSIMLLTLSFILLLPIYEC